MPRPLQLFLAALLPALLLSPALAADPVLSYERVHRQVAHEDNAFRLVVFDDHHVEAHFPFYSPQAGSYRWKITPDEMKALLEMAEPLRAVGSASLARDIARQSAETMSVVTDPDRVTLELDDPARGTHRIVAPSPEVWAEHLPAGHELETVAAVAERLAAWMRDNAQEAQP